jgi:hypothetical protein
MPATSNRVIFSQLLMINSIANPFRSGQATVAIISRPSETSVSRTQAGRKLRYSTVKGNTLSVS